MGVVQIKQQDPMPEPKLAAALMKCDGKNHWPHAPELKGWAPPSLDNNTKQNWVKFLFH